MSSSVYNYLVIGYILPRDYFGEVRDNCEYEKCLEKLVEELKCDYILFNTGYDTKSTYALVPKGYNNQKVLLYEEQFLKVLEEAKKIAQRSTKALPKLVIQSVYYIG